MKLRLGLGIAAAALSAIVAGCASETSPSSDVEATAFTTTPRCTRSLAPEDRPRKVVVTHPYSNGRQDLKQFEVLELSADGQLTKTGATFQMYKPAYGPILFTPDGEIGLVPQDNGKIGVFRFDAHGAVEVLQEGFAGDFWAGDLMIDPSGTRVFALDPDSPTHGGGVYELALGCDGTLTPRGQVVPGGHAYQLGFFPADPNRAVLAAGFAFGSEEPTDTFLLDMRGTTPSVLAKGAGFGDHAAIVSSLAVTPDGRFALIGDDSYTAGNRVAVVDLATMKQKQMLSTESPFAIVASVFNNAAIVVNGDSVDHITAVRYDRNNPATPFTITGRVAYNYPRPQLPGAAVQINRGKLAGRVLVAELLAVRQLQFTTDGMIQDTAQTTWEKSYDGVVGTVGVQP